MNTAPQPLHLVCEIPVATALKAGSAIAGRFAHLLSSPDVEYLTELGLLEVARPFVTIDPDSHTVALELRPDARASVYKGMKPAIVPALAAIRDADLAALHEVERNARSIRCFLQETDELATGNEPRYLERWTAGVLPQDELNSVLRDALFGGSETLEKAPRFRALQAEEFMSQRRQQACPSGTGRHSATFEVVQNVVLDPAEFEIYQRIVKAAQYVAENAKEALGLENVSMAVMRREHIMKCQYSHIPCNATMRRKSVMVTFTWAGITVGRALGLETK
jgi:hypothetical protein